MNITSAETPISRACKDAYENKVDNLKSAIKANPTLINAKDESGRTILHWATSKGNQDMIEYLVDICNSDIEAKDDAGWTPLMIASSAGWQNIVYYFLGKGALVDSINNTKQTSLHYAASKNHLGITIMLLEENGNVNAADNMGNTPLHRAASQGHIDIVKKLVEYKANSNASNNEGNTPLHLACEENREDVAVFLVASGGGDINLKNKEKKSPLEIAEPGLKKQLLNCKGTLS